jgi:ABC-type sugar transport system ATPase subunit
VNFYEAVVADDGGYLKLREGDALPAPTWLKGQKGRALIAGVRPEHLRRVGNSESGLELKVEVIEMLGADSYFYGRVPGEATDTVGRAEHARSVAPGDVMRLTADAQHIHVFDPETGARIEPQT